MNKILIIRLSAIGDVAMTIPVIHSLAMQYTRSEITVLSRSSLKTLFQHMPENVKFLGVDLKNDYQGIRGLYRLFKELKTEQFDCVADFHDVLRTKVLRTLFYLSGTSVASIDKGRSGKKALVRQKNKVLEQQPTSFQRYADVLKELGFSLYLEFFSIYGRKRGDISLIRSVVGEKGMEKWVGIAPFAAHKGKIYPLELQEQVLASLTTLPNVKVFLFGGGKKEQEVLEAWAVNYPNTVSLIGKLNMSLELNLMSHLNVMVSMDSANMHLASLVATPVVSVWGATHPYAGFMGWGQSIESVMQVSLECRPCSVYGQKECFRGDYACLTRLTPGRIVNRIKTIIENPHV